MMTTTLTIRSFPQAKESRCPTQLSSISSNVKLDQTKCRRKMRCQSECRSSRRSSRRRLTALSHLMWCLTTTKSRSLIHRRRKTLSYRSFICLNKMASKPVTADYSCSSSRVSRQCTRLRSVTSSSPSTNRLPCSGHRR